MKFYINGKFLSHRITGVERYAHEICKQIDVIISEENLIDKFVILIPKGTKCELKLKNIQIREIGILKDNLWEQISLPNYVRSNKGMLINLCNVAPIFSPGIVCVHDVKIKARPSDFSKKFLLWYRFVFSKIIKKSKNVITVSEFSKNEIIKYYKVDPTKISIIYNSWQHFSNIDYDDSIIQRLNLGCQKYFFAMSSLEPNKNIKWIFEVANKNKDTQFVIAGSLNKKVFAKSFNQQVPTNVKLIGYVSDSEAKSLMKNSYAFLFPTFYEGFGIPPLEAVSSGCKRIVVSDISVMHELFGDTANFINPNEYNYSLDNLKEIDPGVLSKFSWHSSAKQLLKIAYKAKDGV